MAVNNGSELSQGYRDFTVNIKTTPVAAEGQQVSISTRVTVPTTQTERPALLFSHFWGGSSRTWHRVIEEVGNEYVCIAPSLRGWGESIGPDDEQLYSMKDYASDLVAVVRELRQYPNGQGEQPSLVSNISPQELGPIQSALSSGIILIGHSMGGKIAQYIVGANLFANIVTVKGLLLLGPAPLSSFKLPTFEMQEQQKHAYDSREAVEFVLRNVLTGKTSVLESEIQELATDALQGNPHAKTSWIEYGMAEDYTSLLSSFNTDGVECSKHDHWKHIQVICLVGEADVVETFDKVQSEVVARLNKLLIRVGGKPVDLRVLKNGCGHLVPIEQPEAIASAVKQLGNSR